VSEGEGGAGATQRSRPDVAAVVVSHESGQALLECVASLRRAGAAELVVVDHASRDGAPARVAAAHPDVLVFERGANPGYGAGVNYGAARTTAPYLLACNADVVVEPDALARLAGALDEHPDVGAVGPAVLDASGRVYPSARAFPSLRDAAGHAFVGLVWRANPWTRRYQQRDADAGRARDADWVSGSCVLLRRSAFETVRGFDEGYFMYGEDVDLCWRLRRAGWRVRYEPGARVTHGGGHSTRRHPYRMLLEHHRSAWRFARRTTTSWRRALLPGVAVALAGRLVLGELALLARRRRGTGG